MIKMSQDLILHILNENENKWFLARDFYDKIDQCKSSIDKNLARLRIHHKVEFKRKNVSRGRDYWAYKKLAE